MAEAARSYGWDGPWERSRWDEPRSWRAGPGWIALVVIGFIFWWPLGLALLAYSIWSGRMGCWGRHDSNRWDHKVARMQEKVDRMRARMGGTPPSSGNRAFDEYRAETLRRLEDEEREFRDFLERLRQAKDKAEFDQFMTQRRHPGDVTPAGQA